MGTRVNSVTALAGGCGGGGQNVKLRTLLDWKSKVSIVRRVKVKVTPQTCLGEDKDIVPLILNPGARCS
jgi:hypothetical protein